MVELKSQQIESKGREYDAPEYHGYFVMDANGGFLIYAPKLSLEL